ncbi:MAG: protein translocase SEC61 complex subunit gamma [Candidatus Micrarchaeota archaeon]|nr:protein translocase SEC61 complex subunit gamma [Candidatus Micrarchaeota archaeon]
MDVAGFFRQIRRIIAVASLPRKKEFETIVKVTVLGILIIGILGAIIAFLLEFV